MDKVRIAMIGCGGFQRHRLGNLLQIKEAEVVALVDPSEHQISLTRERHPALGSIASFSGHREMLEEVRPDAVAIATPHTQHVEQILDSFSSGAAVLCEKPLVCSVDDAHKVLDARGRSGRVGMVSYQRHFQPEFRYIREMIRSGAAGDVQFVSALQGQGWLRGTRGTWRQELALSGGGQLNDSGSHLVDIILWITGLSADRVSAYGNNFDSEVDINTSLAIRFKNGALGSMGVVGNGIGWHEDVTIFCEEMVFYVRDSKLTITDQKGNKLRCEELGGGSTPDRNFVDAVLGRAEVESPFEAGLEVIRLTEAAWRSVELDGQAVQVA